MKIVKTKQIYVDCPKSKSTMMMTYWSNGEGVDINLCSRGSYRFLSLTYPELSIIKKNFKVLSDENDILVEHCTYWDSVVTMEFIEDGFNLYIFTHRGYIQRIRLTRDEFKIIKTAAKKLDRSK